MHGLKQEQAFDAIMELYDTTADPEEAMVALLSLKAEIERLTEILSNEYGLEITEED